MASSSKTPPPQAQPEKDKGFGQSHGNPPGHEGPSGPGDVPATAPAKKVPLQEGANDDDEP